MIQKEFWNADNFRYVARVWYEPLKLKKKKRLTSRAKLQPILVVKLHTFSDEFQNNWSAKMRLILKICKFEKQTFLMLSCAGLGSLKCHYHYWKSRNPKKSDRKTQFFFNLSQLRFKIFWMKKATELQMSLEEKASKTLPTFHFQYLIWYLRPV